MTPPLTRIPSVCAAGRPVVLSPTSKIRAVCFAPASAYNDVLFLAKSLPAISYTACTISPLHLLLLFLHHLLPPPLFCLCPPPSPTISSPSSLGRNMSFSSPHATAVRGDLRARLKEAGGTLELWLTPSACLTGYSDLSLDFQDACRTCMSPDVHFLSRSLGWDNNYGLL